MFSSRQFYNPTSAHIERMKPVLEQAPVLFHQMPVAPRESAFDSSIAASQGWSLASSNKPSQRRRCPKLVEEQISRIKRFTICSASITGKHHLNFEMLDAKIETASKKILENSNFKKKVFFGRAESPERQSISSRTTHRP